MKAPLLQALSEQLASGLMRQASTVASRWAQNYVILGKPVPGPLSYKYHPWSEEWVNWSGDWVGKKAAQMAMSLSAIVRTLFTIDILRNDVLYVLPKKNPDATDFSRSKFDPLLELSPHLKQMFSNVANVGHKQAGATNLFIRGARSKSALKAISAALHVWDEFDEMPKGASILGDERKSGYMEADRQTIKFSTPTTPGFGVSVEFEDTTKETWIFRCPCCSRWTDFRYPESLKITADSHLDNDGIAKSHYICYQCKNVLEQAAKIEYLSALNAHWEPEKKNPIRGFQINQMYSIMHGAPVLAKMALLAKVDPIVEQEFNNSKLAKAHEVAGARVQVEQIRDCYGTHRKSDPPPRPAFMTMGIDVGKVLHYHIDQWLLPANLGKDLNIGARPVVRYEGFVKEFEDLDKLMYEWQILHAVIDHEPETRKAHEFARRFEGHVHLAYPHVGLRGKQLSWREGDDTVGFHRTSWLDLVMGRFKRGKQGIILPIDLSQEFISHVGSLVRVETFGDREGIDLYKLDPSKRHNLEVRSRYNSEGPDHATFARLYSELALPLAMAHRENKNIEAFL